MDDAGDLPPAGSVLGVDVGFSYERASSAVCRLDWDEAHIAWTIRRFRDRPEERVRTISETAGNRTLLAAAFDGPLGPGLGLIGHYRSAEKLLTRRLAAKIGKPGQTNTPAGRKLNEAANACARAVLDHTNLAPACHKQRIDPKAVMESYPTGFLGVMLPDPLAVTTKRNDRSDIFFFHLVANGTLQQLLRHVLPGREAGLRLETITNHDDRAAFVCALAALCVVAGDYTAAGDEDGWIILPPMRLTRSWAACDLQENTRRPDCHGRYCSSKEGFFPAPDLANTACSSRSKDC